TMKSAGAKESKPQAESDAKPAAAKDSKPQPQSDDRPASTASMEDPGAEAAATSEAPRPIAIKPKTPEKRDTPKKSISPSAVVTDGSAGDLHVHPAMSANQSAAPTAIAAPPVQPEPSKPAVDADAG